MDATMVKPLDRAMAELAVLPEADEEPIAGELLAHPETLRSLRSNIEAGLCSLDAGEGRRRA
ncbi:hypothetical protein [Rhodovulum sp. PH10]|uniref:hypothetical protein n=1 Tax=Rhodovulum sp. PH10 TaxID=1187851 RepID=UPI0002FDF5D9|nr:hypothetical protein [Rhodovulum sp. PH10]